MGSSFDVRGCFLALLVAPSFVRETKVTRSLFAMLNPLVKGRFCHDDDGISVLTLVFSSFGKALALNSSILHLQYATNGAVIVNARKGGQSVVNSTQLVIFER